MQECVIGVTFDKEKKKILAVQRSDVSVWVIPGGGVDPGESLESAVRREVMEETGLEVAVVRKAAHYTPINKLSGPVHLFELVATGGKFKLSSETRDVGFFEITDLPKPFFELHLKWLNDVLQFAPKTMEKPLDAITYRAVILYALSHPIYFYRFLITKLFKR